ncbi:MAG: hypothetical protein MJZ03_02015 [archaeon]|nr:hypothetical protein [archaeon]
MNSKELFLATLRMEQKEYVPFFPRDLTLGMDSMNIPTGAIFDGEYNYKLSSRCTLSLQKILKSDATVGCIASYSLQSIGGALKYTEFGIPYVSAYPLEDISRIDNIEVANIRNGIVSGMKKASEITKKERPDLALVTNVPGPMTMAGFVRGLETLMMDLLINVKIADRILKFSTDMIFEEIEYMADDVSDAVFLASASDNPDMIGSDKYLHYSLKNVKKISDKVHSMNLLTIYHPHGVFSTDDRQHLLKASVNTGIDGFQFAEGNESEGIKEICRDKCAILGGVMTHTTLLLGPENRIIRDVNRYLNDMENEYYIMTCSCSLNRGQPLNYLKTMTDHLHVCNGGKV